jgi:hypothetical protein
MSPMENIEAVSLQVMPAALFAEIVKSYRSFLTVLHVQHVDHVARLNDTITPQSVGAVNCGFCDASG